MFQPQPQEVRQHMLETGVLLRQGTAGDWSVWLAKWWDLAFLGGPLQTAGVAFLLQKLTA